MADFFDRPAPRPNPYTVTPAPAPFGAPGAGQPLQMQSSNPFDDAAEDDEYIVFDDPAPSPSAPAAVSPQNMPQQQPIAQPQQLPPQQMDMSAPPPAVAPTNTSTQADPAMIASMEHRRAAVADMIATGATKAQIEQFVTSWGGDATQIVGLEEALAYRDAGNTGAIPVGIRAPEQPPEEVEKFGPDRGPIDAFGQGVTDSLTIGAGDEINAAADAARNSIQNLVGLGDGRGFGDFYADRRDDYRQQLRDAQEYHPGYTIAGQVVGGLATVPLTGGAGAARSVGQIALRGALEGGAYGGAYGFNSAEGNISDRAVAGAKGAAMGAAIGGGASGVLGAAARPSTGYGREVLDAADRLNVGVPKSERIRPILSQTSGGGAGSKISDIAENTFTMGQIAGIEKAQGRFVDGMESARTRIPDDVAGGASVNLDDAAARINDRNTAGSLASYEAESLARSNQLYSIAAQKAGGQTLATPNTIAALDRKIAEMRRVPGGVSGMDKLIDLRDELASGRWTVDGLRRLRTSFGDKLDITDRDARTVAKAIWPSLSDDIFDGLRQAGRDEAARAYKVADRNYSKRADELEIVRQIVGDGSRTADQVADTISRMSKNDYVRLDRAIKRMPVDQQQMVRGALLHDLGRAKASRQVGDNTFSLEIFATSWDRTRFSDQAKAALFPASVIRDLDDLSTLAKAARLGRRSANPTNSGNRLMNAKEFTTIGVAVGTGAAFTGPAIAGAALALAGGKALASPGFARALVALGDNKSIEIVAKRLSEAARRSPGAATEILGVRDWIIGQQSQMDRGVTIDPPKPAANPFMDDATPAIDPANPFMDDPGGEYEVFQ